MNGRARTSKLRMPDKVRELARPWKSLVGEVPGLTMALEKEFRFGHLVIPFGQDYRKGGSIKGGSSSLWSISSKEEYDAYCAWRELEGIRRYENRAAYEDLYELCESHGIELLNAGTSAGAPGVRGVYRPMRGMLYELALGVLKALPENHLSRTEFGRLELGGWGPDSAKASAYEDGAVLMYDFAIKGAKRTFLGLLLHELGHAQEAALPAGTVERLRGLHRVISQAGAFPRIEFLLEPESRSAYQSLLPGEFLAETYLAYAALGERLREFIHGLSGDVREAWNEVYALCVNTFDGVEYD